MNPRIAIALSLLFCVAASIACAQIGGRAGAYSRLGFGARGMGMGNTLVAVTSGEVVAYYNPALLPFAESRNVSAAFGILTLDRKLNFLGFAQPLPPYAGLSVGIINSGVSNIDGRDADGEPTGPLRTSENQVFLGFGIKFKPGFSLGLNLKFLYHHLYTDVTSTTVGVDIGAVVPVGQSVTLGATVRDVGSKYKWDTSKLYGQQGTSTEDRFPQLYVFGGAYRLPDSLGLFSAEIEASDQSSLTLRFGAEVPLIPEVTVRAGLDRIDLKEKGNGVRPTFGFTLRRDLEGWTPAVNYAYIIEPFTTSGMHVISLSVVF